MGGECFYSKFSSFNYLTPLIFQDSNSGSGEGGRSSPGLEPEPEKEKRGEEEELKSLEEKKEEENEKMAEAPKKRTRRKKKRRKPAEEGGAAASMWADAPEHPRHIPFGMPAGEESPLHSDDLMCPPGCACDWCSPVDAPDDFSIEKWAEEQDDRKYL